MIETEDRIASWIKERRAYFAPSWSPEKADDREELLFRDWEEKRQTCAGLGLLHYKAKFAADVHAALCAVEEVLLTDESLAMEVYCDRVTSLLRQWPSELKPAPSKSRPSPDPS